MKDSQKVQLALRFISDQGLSNAFLDYVEEKGHDNEDISEQLLGLPEGEEEEENHEEEE